MNRHRSPLIGIDLGTTRSVIATLDVGGRPVTLRNREGDTTTPSAVLWENGSATVGKEAIKALAVLPENVAICAKREMGNPLFSRSLDGKSYPPEMIQSLILSKLCKDAAATLGEPIKSAVITVPAYFNEPKRRATRDAGMLAGLQVQAIINEPTAAAIAYRVNRDMQPADDETILVYDLGGGTFDVSIVRFSGTKIEVIATDGNAMLGGMDWDLCLTRWLDAKIAVEHGIRPSQSFAGQQTLMREAEELKHALTVRKRVDVRFSYEGLRFQSQITREEFEEITAHLLDRTRFTVRKLLGDAQLTWIEIDRILLVGGSTRMPQVTSMLLKESGIQPDASVSPDEVVAHGAALYAATLGDAKSLGEPVEAAAEQRSSTKSSLPASKLKLIDVNTHNLGVLGIDKKTGSRCNHVMITRGTPLPASKTARFETIRPHQPNVVVEVIEGGDARGRHATPIGRCVVSGLPPKLPAGTPVDVQFHYDTDGLIVVHATLPKTGQSASLHIDRASGLSDAELSKMRDIHLALGLDDED